MKALRTSLYGIPKFLFDGYAQATLTEDGTQWEFNGCRVEHKPWDGLHWRRIKDGHMVNLDNGEVGLRKQLSDEELAEIQSQCSHELAQDGFCCDCGLESDEFCSHDEHDHGVCLDCGKDVFDQLVSKVDFD